MIAERCLTEEPQTLVRMKSGNVRANMFQDEEGFCLAVVYIAGDPASCEAGMGRSEQGALEVACGKFCMATGEDSEGLVLNLLGSRDA